MQGNVDFKPFLESMAIKKPLLDVDDPSFQANPFSSMCSAAQESFNNQKKRRPPVYRNSMPLPKSID